MGSILAWVGGSVGIVIAILATYILFRWIISISQAGDQLPVYARNIILLILGIGLFGWNGVNWFYGQMKAGAAESPITADVLSVIGQAPEDFGLGPLAGEAAALGVPGAEESGSGLATQPAPVPGGEQPLPQPLPQQPQIQTFARPPDVTFTAVSVTSKLGKTSDICGYSSVEVEIPGGSEWQYTASIPCNDEDLPSSSAININPSTLTASSGFTLPPIPTPAPAKIIPTAIPTPIPPTPKPTPDPNLLAAQCAALWSDWATTVDLPNSREQWGTGIAPVNVNFTVRGGQGFWSSAAGEAWYLNITSLGVENYRINGVVGRSLPGSPQKGSIKQYKGSGPQCAELFR